MRILFCLLFLAMLASCTEVDKEGYALPKKVRAADAPPETGQGRKFLGQLVQAIRNADRIVVTEHSDPMDVFDGENYDSLPPDDLIYDTRVLDARKKAELIKLLQGLPPRLSTYFQAVSPKSITPFRLKAPKDQIPRWKFAFNAAK